MRSIAILTLIATALAAPGGWSHPHWWGADEGPSDEIPPESVRSQFPQFDDSLWEKYHCFTYDKLLTLVPPCSYYCEYYSIGEAVTPDGFGRDGCHPDDFPCHCANSEKISNLIEPCIFPFLNATAECALADLRPIQTFVTESCQFFNATQYADYKGCGRKINRQIKQDIKAGSAPIPTMEAQKFCPRP